MKKLVALMIVSMFVLGFLAQISEAYMLQRYPDASYRYYYETPSIWYYTPEKTDNERQIELHTATKLLRG